MFGSTSSVSKKQAYTPSMTTGQKIKLIRKEKDWSQRDLAKATGLTWGIINRYEHDKAFPIGESLIKLCSIALG
jgi:transcriptional regulator with XRE-family HTH domain